MTPRHAFIRPAQRFVSFALSALLTVLIFSSVNGLAAQPAQDAQLACMVAPAASRAQS